MRYKEESMCSGKLVEREDLKERRIDRCKNLAHATSGFLSLSLPRFPLPPAVLYFYRTLYLSPRSSLLPFPHSLNAAELSAFTHVKHSPTAVCGSKLRTEFKKAHFARVSPAREGGKAIKQKKKPPSGCERNERARRTKLSRGWTRKKNIRICLRVPCCFDPRTNFTRSQSRLHEKTKTNRDSVRFTIVINGFLINFINYFVRFKNSFSFILVARQAAQSWVNKFALY